MAGPDDSLVNSLDAAQQKAPTLHGISLQTFLASLTVSFSLFGVEILIFLCLRNAVRVIYQPRKSEKSTYDWIKSLVNMSDAEILPYSDLDAMLFHRYISSILQLFVLLAIIILPVLIPLNIIHGKKASEDVRGLDRLSWANIDVNHIDYYWAHMMMLIYTVVLTCVMIYREMIFYIKVRQDQLRIQMQTRRLSARTILVTGIPRDLLFQDKLNSLYSKTFSEIERVWINRDYRKLIKAIEERAKLRATLEGAELKAMKESMLTHTVDRVMRNRTEANASVRNHPGHRREHQNIKFEMLSWLPALSIMGEKLKSIDQYRYEMVRLNHEITSMQANITDFPEFNSAFITFGDAKHAILASQSLVDPRPATLVAQCIGVEPQQIVWKNLGISWWERSIRTILVGVCVIFLIITWALPIAFTGFLSQISYVIDLWPSLRFLEKTSNTILGLIQGFLPQVLLMILTMLLPQLLRLLTEQQGLLTTSAIELFVQRYYFAFLFIHVFLTVSLTSSITTIGNKIYHGFDSVPKVLAQNLPKTSNYFFSYILLQGLSISAGQFIQIVSLAKWYLLGPMLDKTPRAKLQRRLSLHTNMQWGTVFPTFTNLACIGIPTRRCGDSDDTADERYSGLIYSIIAPLILPICVLAFGMFLVVFRYTCIFVYQSDFGMKEHLFPAAWNQVFTGLYTLELCATGLFILVRNQGGGSGCIGQAVLTAVVTIFTVVFQIKLNSIVRPMMSDWALDPTESSALEQIFSGRQQTSLRPARRVPDDIDRFLSERQAPTTYQHPSLLVQNPVIWIPKDDKGVTDDQIRLTQAIDKSLVMTNAYSSITANGEVTVADISSRDSAYNETNIGSNQYKDHSESDECLT